MNGNCNSSVRLFVENRAEEIMAAGMFADYIHDERLIVRMCWTSSSAISLAESWLLTNPNVPVAVALNCSGDPDEFRTPIERIFYRAAPATRWHVAVAVPDMTSWLLEDSQFAESFERAAAAGRPSTKIELAVQFKEWANSSGNQFNREEASQNNDEFAALCHYIQQHIVTDASAAN